MTTSVIICTRNRSASLEKTLRSIESTSPGDGLRSELLVIDNASTDDTQSVLRHFNPINFTYRHTIEPEPGLSHARNRGLGMCSGECILWTDDDVRVPRDWIVKMVEPIRAGRHAVAGGVVFPPHIDEQFRKRALVSRRSWFASTHELDSKNPARMVGANMAFHRDVLNSVPAFEEELGPGALGFGEETLFSEQALAHQFRLVGQLDTSVVHEFDLSRFSRKELLASARKMGRSHAWSFHHWRQQSSRLALIRLLVAKAIRQRAIRTRTDQDVISDELLRAEQDVGFYSEYLIQRRKVRKYAPTFGLPTA